MMLVDSHCHLDFPDFASELDAVVDRARGAGIGRMVTISTRVKRHDQVLGLLRSLPEEWRLPISMRYLGGADYDTVCRQLGLTNGSLRGLLNRGMARLRQLMSAGEE